MKKGSRKCTTGK